MMTAAVTALTLPPTVTAPAASTPPDPTEVRYCAVLREWYEVAHDEPSDRCPLCGFRPGEP